MSDESVYRSPYNPGLPELAEMPNIEIKDATTTGLRLQGTLAKRLPPMPGGSLEDLYGTDYRQEAQLKEAQAIGIANEINKAYLKRNSAIAKAKNYQATKAAENAPRYAADTRRKQVGNEKRKKKGMTKWFAREVLGVGPSLYR